MQLLGLAFLNKSVRSSDSRWWLSLAAINTVEILGCSSSIILPYAPNHKLVTLVFLAGGVSARGEWAKGRVSHRATLLMLFLLSLQDFLLALLEWTVSQLL